MRFSRRDLLKGAGVLAISQLLNFHWIQSALASAEDNAPTSSYNIDDLDILTQGRDGKVFMPSSKDENLSVAIRLSIKTGKYHIEPVPILAAHELVFIPKSGRHFLLSRNGNSSAMLSPDTRYEKKLFAKDGFEFAGHGVVLPDEDHIAVSLRHRNDDDNVKKGAIGVFDVNSGKLAYQLDMEGNYPHDIKLNTAKTHLVFANRSTSGGYGDEAEGDEYKGSEQRGRITALNLSNFKVDYEIQTPAGDPRHIIVTDEDKLYAVSNRTATMDDVIENGWGAHELEEDRGWEPQWPDPIVEYDLNKKSTRTTVVDLKKQRRSQSVAFNKETGKTAAVFVFGQSLVTIDKEGNERIFDTQSYKIESPIGLQTVDGTSLMAIGDAYFGVSLVDMNTMELVRHYPVKLYRSSHITISPSQTI